MHRFKLEALLTHRRHQEEMCQKELAEAQRRLSDEKDELRRRKQEKLTILQDLQHRQKEKINVSNIILSFNYLEQLSKKIEEQRICVQRAKKTLDHKRQELIIIVKKRKTLEKLKEKDWQTYQQNQMQNERKFMDEVASTRHARKV